jgi:hypothetical protein
LKIRGLIWDDRLVQKIAMKHDVRRHEIREIFDNRPAFRFVEKGNYPGENVYSASAQAEAGRYLIVFFIYKKTGFALPISARDMTFKERKEYAKRK